jgi:hypothetical protein
MSRIQYTIRAIPPGLDKALRQKSKATGKSLSDVVIATLEKGAGVNTQSTFHDLDWFIGGKSLEQTFAENLEWLNSAPQDT